MRTKTLLGLAALAVGLTSASAQVYSLNVVGYVNVPLQANKLSFISVPLVPSGGDFNITNTIVLSDAQADAVIFAWNNTSWNPNIPTWYAGGGGWDPQMVISNGVGFFIQSKANSTLTFVGEVPQGAIQYNIPAGLSTLANKVPQSDSFPGATVGNADDTIFTWDMVNQKWGTAVWTYYAGYGWDEGSGTSSNGPALNPADAVFYVNKGAALPFARNFTVQ